MYIATNAISDMSRSKRSKTKVVQKDLLLCVRSLYSWVMYLKILIRENLENWDRRTPSNSPRAPATKIKFGKERVHGEGSSKSVRLMSVVLARQNSEKDHMRRPCTKKEAPAKQHGIWRKKLKAQEFGQNTLCTPVEAKVMRAPTSTRLGEREFVVDSGASMHIMSRKLNSREMHTIKHPQLC